MTIAGLCKFVIADLSGPSVPAELQSIFGQLKKPLLALGDAYALFPDICDQTSVLTLKVPPHQLLDSVRQVLPRLEELHRKRMSSLAQRYGAG